MPKILVNTRNGDDFDIEAPLGVSLMQSIRDSGIDELLALCGGVCSCATCHIYVDSSFASALPAISQDESDLLEGSSHRNETSRLACQISMSAELAGLRMTIAPED